MKPPSGQSGRENAHACHPDGSCCRRLAGVVSEIAADYRSRIEGINQVINQILTLGGSAHGSQQHTQDDATVTACAAATASASSAEGAPPEGHVVDPSWITSQDFRLLQPPAGDGAASGEPEAGPLAEATED